MQVNKTHVNYAINCVEDGETHLLKSEEMDERPAEREWHATLKYPKYKVVGLNMYINDQLSEFKRSDSFLFDDDLNKQEAKEEVKALIVHAICMRLSNSD